MRALIKFKSSHDAMKDTLVVILKDYNWWPSFDQDTTNAQSIISEVQSSVDDKDAELFKEVEKVVLFHTPTGSSGTLSLEHNVWVVRILNSNIQLLQVACEIFIAQVMEYTMRNHKPIDFMGDIKIVERKQKESIIAGRTLASPQARRTYARLHRGMEYKIFIIGVIVFVILLFITFPYQFRDFNNLQQTWLFSIFEKLIGSIVVTTLISGAQYITFLNSLRDHSIRWSVPGEPEKLDIKPHG